MPAVARVITKSEAPYTYLPRSIEAFYPPEEFQRLLKESGFGEVKALSLSMGVATLYSGIKGR